MIFYCWNCYEKIERKRVENIYCPKCGSRVLFVGRNNIAREISTD